MGNPNPSPTPSPTPNPTPSPSPGPAPTPGFTKVGDGFCRTAAGLSGTFEVVVAANLDQCLAACSASPACVAIEFQTTRKCELHSEEITQVANNGNSQCFVKEVPSTPETTPSVTAPQTTVSETTSPPQIRFVAELSEGTCPSVGGLPVNDQALCEQAAAVLGVPDRTASRTNAVSRPEGCYVFRGNRLFMGVNPASQGNGAETSTRGRSRHPICGFTS